MRIRRAAGAAVTVLALVACGAPDDPAPGDDAVRSQARGAETDATEETDAIDGDDATDETSTPSQDPVTSDEDEAQRRQPVLSLVATVAPIADLVAVVGGDRVEVSSLVPSGADAHTYEPRPQDVVKLTDADAYIGVGHGLNAGALRLADENLASDAPTYLLGELVLDDEQLIVDHGHDEQDDGHSHDGEEADGHSHDGEAGPNPHVWTSLRNTMRLVEGIADALADLDPVGTGTYDANAERLLAELAQLDRDVAAALATVPEDARTLVTYHGAWAYFARDYDLTFATALQPADFSEPSAGEMRALVDLIRELDVSVVFGSEEFPTPVLEAIAGETDAVYVDDLSDDVLPGESSDRDHSYMELMRRNAVTIVSGLGGDATGLTG